MEESERHRATNAPGNANLPIGTGDGNANQEIGVPREVPSDIRSDVPGPPTWQSRGFLPHFDGANATQHVTFHLADSLPKEVLERMELDIQMLPIHKQDVERRKRIEAWIDAGHGSCVLREPVIGEMVQNALLFFDAQRYRLLAWVVMPNHVHVLFQPINGWTVAKIVASWKKFTAKKICEYRKNAPGNANLLIGSSEEANQEIGVPGGDPASPVWHREYWDRYMRDGNHLHQATEYIHQNPVKAGLVKTSEEWQWSSAYSGWGTPPGETPPGTPIS